MSVGLNEWYVVVSFANNTSQRIFRRYSKVYEQPLSSNHPPIKTRAEGKNTLVLQDCAEVFLFSKVTCVTVHKLKVSQISQKAG